MQDLKLKRAISRIIAELLRCYKSNSKWRHPPCGYLLSLEYLAIPRTTPIKVSTATKVDNIASIGKFHAQAAFRAEINVAVAGNTIQVNQRNISYRVWLSFILDLSQIMNIYCRINHTSHTVGAKNGPVTVYFTYKIEITGLGESYAVVGYPLNR